MAVTDSLARPALLRALFLCKSHVAGQTTLVVGAATEVAGRATLVVCETTGRVVGAGWSFGKLLRSFRKLRRSFGGRIGSSWRRGWSPG